MTNLPSLKSRLAVAASVLLFLNASISPACAFSSIHHAIARPTVTKPFTTSPSSLHVRPSPIMHESQRLNSSALPMSSAAAATTTIDESDDKDPPLFETFLKGIRRDYSMRLPHYPSDITNGLNTQCLAAVLFLFFACLAPAVGFGALFGSVTNGAIGTMEMVSSTAMCGFLYALFSAQPLTIIGSTGPVLAFVAALVQLAEKMK